MALAEPVTSMFGEEWERFVKGVKQLDPDYMQTLDNLTGRGGRRPGEVPTVNVPGWDSVIVLGNRKLVTGDDWKELAAARREGRAPRLDADTLGAMAQRRAQLDAMRTTAQPDYLRGWIDIMTAVDNVQDFFSSVATLGRFALWAGTKVGLRAIPGLGAVVLVSDILNLLNLLGTLAIPLYGMLCSAPSAALAAGMPGILGKQMLKRETWTIANWNPFSRSARAARVLRSAGRLPSVGNLLEVGQTTQQLFGVGISLGSLYGMVVETASGIELNARGHPVRINFEPFAQSMAPHWVAPAKKMDTAPLAGAYRASQVLRDAPLISGQQDVHPEWIHYEHMAALLAAVGPVYDFVRLGPHETILEAATASPLYPPTAVSEHVRAEFAALGIEVAERRGFALPGNPATLSADAYTAAVAHQVGAAAGGFYEARRSDPRAHFWGAAVNVLTEQLFRMLTDDRDFFKWSLTPDWQLFVSLPEAGRLIPATAPPAAVERFWTAAKRKLSDESRGRLDAPELDALARAAGLQLFTLLPPEASMPVEWTGYLSWLKASAAGPA